MFILVVPNYSELVQFFESKRNNTEGLVQNVVQEDLSLRPHLNTALRSEIIYFTTQVTDDEFDCETSNGDREFDLLRKRRSESVILFCALVVLEQ